MRGFLPGLLAIIVASATAADPDAAAAAKEKKMSAVNKALALLTDLQAKVMAEGEKEAATYNKFACFCKDTTKEKLEAITKGEDEKASLTADIQSYASTRDQMDTDILTAQSAIKTAEDEIAAASKQRAGELKLYEANSADLKAALAALTGAIQSLKAAKPSSFVQLTSAQSAQLQSTLALADTLGLSQGTQQVQAWLQEPAVPIEDYKFKSDSIISTLEGLLKDFRAQRDEVDAAEVEAVNLHEKLLQEKHDTIKQETTKMETAQKNKAQAIADLGSASSRLSTVSSVLMDDKEYANGLSKMCSDKATAWDQRSQMRADELQVLTQAIGIVKSTVSDKTSASTIRFAQQGVSLRLAREVARSPEAMEAIEAVVEEAPAFLSLATRHQVSPSEDVGRHAIQSLLRTKGLELKSAVLTSLASQIGEDPFGKIKVLIQELIERLQQQATNEATQKGWCDKSLAMAKQKRDYATKEVSSLNSQMATLEALRAKLNMEVKDLAKAIKEIQDAQTEATKLREDEKAEHASVVQEAKEGLDALDTVIDLLDKFYKTASKAEVTLIQQTPQKDAPDAGFDTAEAYRGAQGDATGILGMLQVMKSDFTRTVTETEAAEKLAEKEYQTFLTESGKSLAEKEQANTEKSRQLSDANSSFDEASSSMQAQMQIVTGAIKELIELQPACVNTGMTYEERVANREEEIKALNKALCILDAYAQYGPDSSVDSC